MTSYGIVILNYISYGECINCVESFKKYIGDNRVHIVIVDNCSPNDSVIVLKEKYNNDGIVDIIELENNVGFAKGNNIGCKHLMNNYKCDFIIFSNSDILICDDVYSWIKTEKEITSFDLLGPDIYSVKNNNHQNPIKRYTSNRFIINLKIAWKQVCVLFYSVLGLLNVTFFHLRAKKNIEVNKNTRIIGEPLHGSFIVADVRFFSFYPNFFDPRTFLYMEEYLLYLRCQRAGLKTVISYDFQVVHLQGASTSMSSGTEAKKRIVRLRNEIKSLSVYRKEVSKNMNTYDRKKLDC